MNLKNKLDAGDFAILAEMQPPKGVDVSMIMESATKVKGRMDAFLVPEMSSAVMRMSSLGEAMILQSKGMETIIQFNCRDRNRLALQGDLLAAYACGISNIMTVTGEEPSYGDHPQAKAVHDLSIIELLYTIQTLQGGIDMSGIDLTGSPQFFVGSTANSALKGEALEIELEEVNKKNEAGAQFFITPPLFDITSIETFRKKVHNKIHIIPTVLLLKSVGMARYIDRNLEHIYIPPDLIRRIQDAPDQVRDCIKIAANMINSLKHEGFNGVLLSTIGWEDKLAQILDEAKIL